MRRINLIVVLSLILAVLLVACGGASQGGDSAPSIPETNTTDGDMIDSTREPTILQLDTQLSRLYRNWQTDPTGAEAAAIEQGMIIEDGHVLVTMTMYDEQAAENAVATLDDYGAELYSHGGKWVDVWTPISNLEKLASMQGLALIMSPSHPHFGE